MCTRTDQTLQINKYGICCSGTMNCMNRTNGIQLELPYYSLMFVYEITLFVYGLCTNLMLKIKSSTDFILIVVFILVSNMPDSFFNATKISLS